MLLVADSGSTKCDWLLDNSSGDPLPFHTMGFNPLFHNSDFIASEIQKNDGLMKYSDKITSIHYFGASVSSAERQETVVHALKRVFPNAWVHADHDLMGAAVATCGGNPGIACILGTGSNSCFFDGQSIFEKVPALGYILGDEASGAYFGRELLRNLLYHKLPENMRLELDAIGANKEEIFKKVYNTPGANVYLASFMGTIAKHRSEKIIQQMLINGFLEFLKIHVCCYEGYKIFPVHFVGSVSLHFREELLAACKELEIKTGVFTNEPVRGLFDYYRNLAQNS